MDALSDVLKSVRLEGAVFLNAEFTAPWCVLAKFGLSNARARLAQADQVLYFHYLAEGECKLQMHDANEPMSVRAGDLILFTREERHVMGSDLQLTPVETASLVDPAEASGTQCIQLRHGGGGAPTHFVCGYLACSRSTCRPLLDALPRVLRIPLGDDAASRLLKELLQAGVNESTGAKPGTESVLAKLSELMFVQAMRRYAESLPPGGQGWLAGVRDPQVGKALSLIHADPARAWTVDELAREVALSRSALADRFTSLVGESPIQYLLRWRLALAAQTLRSGSEAIVRIAERSGYESEAAFSRAFKREFGAPPAAWRRASAA